MRIDRISSMPKGLNIPQNLVNNLTKNTVQQCCICGKLLNVPQWQTVRFLVFFCENCNNTPSAQTVLWHIRSLGKSPLSRIEKLKKLKELGFNVGKPDSIKFTNPKTLKIHSEIEKLLNSDEKK